ncbi:MAG: protoheme IX farnesyltransferase [Actinobacteria bacterium]|nr:protoheme IX farnesyltransferase [Actinomycetota bacterium]
MPNKMKAYLALTKPRVIELLLITTLPTMILAKGGLPNFWLVIATLVGGALSAGSANAFNCYIDTDIDKVMGRTKNRPLVTGELSAREALVFSWIIGIASVLWLGLLVNWLASLISLAALGFYVFIYTLILKRRTPQNIVWGGAAGAAPVLIGWAAVTGEVSATAWVLFLIIFLWTPPHYWPLSVKYRADYALAKVPMLPVVRSTKTVVQQILIYAWAVAASTLLLIPIEQMGLIYALTALIGSAWFVIAAYRLYKEGQNGELKKPMSLFHLSNLYLTALFVAIAIDPLIHLNFF